jgi:hypothetical protein
MRAELGWTETVGRSLGLARTVAWERTQPRAASPDYAAEDAALDVTGP